MSAWDALTWGSIVVLVGGSLAVFVWFLRDVRRLLEEDGENSPEE